MVERSPWGLGVNQICWQVPILITDFIFIVGYFGDAITGAISSWLEGKTSVQLNLPAGTDSTENPANVGGEITGSVFEYGVSISSQRERALRVAWHCKIRMIDQ